MQQNVLTYKAYDAADKGVEVTTVSCHDGLLLGQESFPRRLHHVHGHLSDENLHTKKRQRATQKQEHRQGRKENIKLGIPL